MDNYVGKLNSLVVILINLPTSCHKIATQSLQRQLLMKEKGKMYKLFTFRQAAV